MENFRQTKFMRHLIILFVALLLSSCKEEELDPVAIQIADFTASIQENPLNGSSLGTIVANANRGEISFSLQSQNPAGAMGIDPSTGELSVADSSIFDFEVNPVITGMIEVSVDGNTKIGSVTINLVDVAEDINSFILIAYTDQANQTVILPKDPFNSDYNFSVDWGDGSIENNITDGGHSHIYAQAGEYDIAISGNYPSFIISYGVHITGIKNWGSREWVSFENAFANTDRFSLPGDSPLFAQNASISYAFSDATNLSGSIINWDVSKVANFSGVFSNSDGTSNDPNRGMNNIDISNWNTSSATDMSFMFFNNAAFDRPIGNWDVSKVINMRAMFWDALAFNQNIGAWDVSNVTNMSYMFQNSAFDQDVSAWDVSQVTDMSYMFQRSSFNQDIGAWDVSRVETMQAMFRDDVVFNQNISNWDISGLSNTTSLFKILSNTAMSVSNYDALLNGWSANPNTPENMFFDQEKRVCQQFCQDVPSLFYTSAAQVSRDVLINDKGWNIIGDQFVTE